MALRADVIGERVARERAEQAAVEGTMRKIAAAIERQSAPTNERTRQLAFGTAIAAVVAASVLFGRAIGRIDGNAVATLTKCPLTKPATEPEVATDPKPATEPAAAAGPSSATRISAAPFREFIAREVAKGRNSTAIYQDLVEHHGYAGSYDAVKRLVRSFVRT